MIYNDFVLSFPSPNVFFSDEKPKEEHAQAVIKSLTMVFKASQKQLHSLRRILVDLGYRHFAEYGTPTNAYEFFGKSLLKCIENIEIPASSGGSFNAAEYELIQNCWNSVQEWMIDGAIVAENEWKEPGSGRAHKETLKNRGHDGVHGESHGVEDVPRGADGLPLLSIPLTEEDYKNIEDTWKVVFPLGYETIGRLLYQEMFSLRTDLLSLFSFRAERDMYFSDKFKHHTTRVARAVNNAVSNVRRWNSTMVPIFEALGETHIHYKVRPEDFPVMSDCICNVFKAHLKENFTRNIEISWQKFYSRINSALCIGLNKAVEELNQRGGIEASLKTALNLKKDGFDDKNNADATLEDDSNEALSEQDIKDIQQSFEQAKKLGAETIGKLLFQKMLQENASLLKFFKFKDPLDAFSSSTFLHHSTRVIMTVGNAVVNVKRRESILRNLEKLGESHVDHKVKPQYFFTMGECLTYVLEKGLGSEVMKKTVLKAWSKTFRLVAASMSKGLQNELKKRRATGELSDEDLVYWDSD